ncbi:MAG: FAD/NAD(P)-binding oxidoreductase [Propionicimonas sp.]|nr:FAD/NAD(P)-binding oxidoreductase [Propionicimonas sp.]
MSVRYLIVGGGLAAARAVEGIREVDPDGPITVVTAEDRLPYERPPLSKGILLGSDGPDVVFRHPASWYAEQGVAVRQGIAVTSVDAAARTAWLAGGERQEWERLLLATGASVRTLAVPGADLSGIHYLRTLDDSLSLREEFRAGGDVVVVGAGWIGLEAAAAARSHGARVTMVAPGPAPLHSVLGEQVGGWFTDLHRAHGVDVRLNTRVARIEGEAAVTGVTTAAGELIPARIVVAGVGVRPNTALAEAAGAAVDNGILTDAALRTSLPGVWAAGDVAAWQSTFLGTHLRVEHWANALDGGFAAGRSMAGVEVSYDPLPFFYSDQYDAGLEYAGHVPTGTEAEVVLRGDPASGAFLAFWVVPGDGGVRVLAGMHVNTWDTMDAVQGLIRSRAGIDRGRLGDPAVPLEELLP